MTDPDRTHRSHGGAVVHAAEWPPLSFDAVRESLDTVHGHTQVLGKLAAALAPPERQLQHAALRLSARGWETAPLPAPNRSGSFAVVLDLRTHECVVEHSDGVGQTIPLAPNRSVAAVTHDLLDAVRAIAGDVEIDMKPQETPWSTPLDEDTEHATYEPAHVEEYFEAATCAAGVLAAFRAPYAGRSTPVNAWWGSFDLCVSLFSGRTFGPPAEAGFIPRNTMNAEQIEAGWWPGDARHPRPAFFGYAFPLPDGLDSVDVSPGRWDGGLGEFVLDWDDARSAPDPYAAALGFFRALGREALRLGGWDSELAASLEGTPPPVS